MAEESSQTQPSQVGDDAQLEDSLQYCNEMGTKNAEARWPHRPHNHSVTLLFSELLCGFFNPLAEIKAQSTSCKLKRIPRYDHLHRKPRLPPHEQRRAVIMRFISRWRSDVGDDFYPALRLILPDKDRDRSVFGLKENTIGRLLVKLMKIDKNSQDGYNLLHWKLPGHADAGHMTGDFAGRCFEVLAKRPLRTEFGDLRIGQVNVLLNKLMNSGSGAEQLSIFGTFYEHMNPEELSWLIRIILKQTRIGASERTILNLWHPDGEMLFSVSSSLRRVCWELCDSQARLEQDELRAALMQCFQPQLAQFQTPATFQRIVEKLGCTEDDMEFWIEEKLDGERIQMHMEEDDSQIGHRRFRFWSRKAKEYTNLYGNSFSDTTSALTQHLSSAFSNGVRNLILDGEMITWDPKVDKVVAFGTLKTAAIEAQSKPHDQTAPRPLFRVFDILYLNDEPLTQYTMRDRRKALQGAVVGVPRRLEIHAHEVATSPDVIEPILRHIVAESSEGLVLKNPRSIYRLNSRNDDWIKVKPEYMTEFGESLDCLIIGGYFGSGRRGGTLSSFLCGLRVSQNDINVGANIEKCLSFFKVGGGFTAEDYAEIQHLTEGKWNCWDSANPPDEYIELADNEAGQLEKPDLWIRPKDSLVVSVKASSVSPSDSFAVGITLRFPRFRRLRLDRSWDSALTKNQFQLLQKHVGEELREMKIEGRRQRQSIKKARLSLVMAGQGQCVDAIDKAQVDSTRPESIFHGMSFCILSSSTVPVKKDKSQLEALVKYHGGQVYQQPNFLSGMIIIADKNVVRVASLIKMGDVDIVKPQWLLESLSQNGGAFLLPLEITHLLHACSDTVRRTKYQTDIFRDSFSRDVGPDELSGILRDMTSDSSSMFESPTKDRLLEQLDENGHNLRRLRCLIFQQCVVYFTRTDDTPEAILLWLQNCIRFGAGLVASELHDRAVTHVVILCGTKDNNQWNYRTSRLRHLLDERSKQFRIVTKEWIKMSWKEGTLLNEEQYSCHTP